MADSQDTATDKQPTNTKSLTYECVQCGAPILIEGYYAAMMSFFNMPKRSGLCSKCVNGGIDLVATDKETV